MMSSLYAMLPSELSGQQIFLAVYAFSVLVVWPLRSYEFVCLSRLLVPSADLLLLLACCPVAGSSSATPPFPSLFPLASTTLFLIFPSPALRSLSPFIICAGLLGFETNVDCGFAVCGTILQDCGTYHAAFPAAALDGWCVDLFHLS